MFGYYNQALVCVKFAPRIFGEASSAKAVVTKLGGKTIRLTFQLSRWIGFATYVFGDQMAHPFRQTQQHFRI